MAFVIIPSANIIDISAGTAQVSGADSAASGYPFSNAFDEFDQPWFEWRSAFSSSSEHTLTLSFSGTANVLVIFGANFSSIKRGATTYTLVQNRMAGDYRLFYPIIGMTSPVTLVIPAQDTEEGYFKIGSIILGSSWITSVKSGVYPANRTFLLPSKDITTQGNLIIKQKDGRKHHILEYRDKMRNYTYMAAVNTVKIAEGLTNAFVLYENRSDMSQVFLVRRLADMVYQERGNSNFELSIRMEEIA